MRLDSRLQISRHGIYYLRTQRDGLDQRWSLRTRDPKIAVIAAHEFSARLLKMRIDLTKQYSSFTLRADGDKIELETEDNDADRAAGTAAFLSALAIARQAATPAQLSNIHLPVEKIIITLGTAIEKYKPQLSESNIALKSQKMALGVLSGLELMLGTDFDMCKLDNATIRDHWYKTRIKTIAKTTAKRDLSFIRAFVAWAADDERQYCQAVLTFSIEAKGENYEYFNKDDLKLIFDNLPLHARNSWQFWIVILGLYTGGRIAELAGLRTEYISEKSELNVMRLAGTKTDDSDRLIPIHPDLISLGFLSYVQHRRTYKQEMLFDIKHNEQNGAGAQASKWFTTYKASIGLADRLKVFHSFRHTIVDLMNQASVGDKAGSQYTGHAGAGGVRNVVYGRNPLSLTVMQAEVVDKINWQKYCGWSPDFATLREKSAQFL